MFENFLMILASHEIAVGLSFFAVSFTCLLCYFSLSDSAAKVEKIIIPVTGMSERQAVQRAKALSKGKTKHEYYAVRHVAGTWFCQYEVVRADKYETRRKLLVIDASDRYEIVS